MSIDLNRVLLTGRLGRKPELKKTVNGKPYSRLNVAIHSYAGKGKEKLTQWHQVMVWGPQAEICAQYLEKGSPVLVEGHLRTREYIVENTRRTDIHVSANRIQFLGGRAAADVVALAEMEADVDVGRGSDHDFPDATEAGEVSEYTEIEMTQVSTAQPLVC